MGHDRPRALWYPIFGYIPIGAVALLARTPSQAFVLGRLLSLLMSSAFLLLAAWQLVRSLGRGAPPGLGVAVTPMVVFTAALLSTSGMEITTAVPVGSIAVVATRRPETLADRAILTTLAIAASALLLSRQLGVVSLVLAAVVALSRGRCHGGLAPAAVGPAGDDRDDGDRAGGDGDSVVGTHVRPPGDHRVGRIMALGCQLCGLHRPQLQLFRQGIGWCGRVDTPLPGPATALWTIALVTLIGAAAVPAKAPTRGHSC